MNAKIGKREVVFNLCSILMLMGNFLFIGLSWNQIPNPIPIHYGLSDGGNLFGPKVAIWILPLLSLLSLMAILLLRKGEDFISLPFITKETKRNAALYYYYEMLGAINLVIGSIFTYLIYVTIYSQYQSLLPLFITSACLLMFAIIFSYHILLYRIESSR